MRAATRIGSNTFDDRDAQRALGLVDILARWRTRRFARKDAHRARRVARMSEAISGVSRTVPVNPDVAALIRATAHPVRPATRSSRHSRTPAPPALQAHP